MKILIAESDRQLAASLSSFLEQHAFDTACVYNGDTGAEYARRGMYDLLILDALLPGLCGLQVAREVRLSRCGTPILMLTEKDSLRERVEGLNAGADYCLPKPCDPGELLACIRALLRRQGPQVNELSLGNTTLELSTCLLTCGAHSVRLSSREFEVMRMLLRARGSIVSKERILVTVWGYDSNAVENHVEVYIGFLRKKLASIGSNLRIEALRKLGYHLEAAGAEYTA